MCYVEKVADFWYDGIERSWGPDFNGKFDCARFNCSGCNHRLIHSEAPKRNQGFRMNFIFIFHIHFILEKSKNPQKDFHSCSSSNLVLVALLPFTKVCTTELKGHSKWYLWMKKTLSTISNLTVVTNTTIRKMI